MLFRWILIKIHFKILMLVWYKCSLILCLRSRVMCIMNFLVPLTSTQGPHLFSTQNPSVQHQNPSVQHIPLWKTSRMCWTEAFLCWTKGFWAWKGVDLLCWTDGSVELRGPGISDSATRIFINDYNNTFQHNAV